jgi:hypothetical protein
MSPPWVSAGGLTLGLTLPQPARRKTLSHSISTAALERSCCHAIPGRFGRSARQSGATKYWILRSRCLCSYGW